MSGTQTLDKNRIVKEGITFFLSQEEELKQKWISSIGTESEKRACQEYLIKRDLVSDMIKHLIPKL